MFICSNCQKTYNKWQGQCDNCKMWNTLVENSNFENRNSKGAKGSKLRTRSSESSKPIKLSELAKDDKLKSRGNEMKTGIEEFDNAIGGNDVSGQAFLFAGEPGVGKSTLCLQITDSFSNQKYNVLYSCVAESTIQITQRR